jgi:hypothetical protein
VTLVALGKCTTAGAERRNWAVGIGRAKSARPQVRQVAHPPAGAGAPGRADITTTHGAARPRHQPVNLYHRSLFIFVSIRTFQISRD